MKRFGVLLPLVLASSVAHANRERPAVRPLSAPQAQDRSTAPRSAMPRNLGAGRVVNWAGTTSATPKERYRPASRDELRALLRGTRGRIRFGGSLHSWSRGAITDDTLIDMTGLDRVLELSPEDGTITVEAGATMESIYEYLDARGYALESIPSSAKITLAGAMANAVHGSGARYPATLSDQAVALEYEKTDGSGAVRLTRGSRAAGKRLAHDDLQLGRTSLGSLAALYSATLRIVPRYYLDVQRRNLPAREVIPRLAEIAAAHDHALLFWYPSVNRFHVQTYDHVSEAEAAKIDAPYSTEAKPAEHSPAIERKLARLARVPLGLGLKAYQRLVSTGGKPTRVIQPWHIGPREAATVKPHDVSYAVPPERAEPLFAALHALFVRRGWPQVELWVRPVGKSDSAMSPAFDGPKVMIELFPMQQVGTPAERERLITEARTIFAAHGGKRHWAKEGEGGVERLPAATVDGFQALRQVTDPGQRLRGPYTESIGLD